MNGAFRQKEGQAHEAPETTSRPFSVNRRGFVVSEGAGCIILATEDFTRAHGLSAKIEMAGFGMTSDAGHFVAPNLPTVQRCMELAITSAGLEPQNVDAVNAHATSTKVGDKVEADALANVFGERFRRHPPISRNWATPWVHHQPWKRFWLSRECSGTRCCPRSTIHLIRPF